MLEGGQGSKIRQSIMRRIAVRHNRSVIPRMYSLLCDRMRLVADALPVVASSFPQFEARHWPKHNHIHRNIRRILNPTLHPASLTIIVIINIMAEHSSIYCLFGRITGLISANSSSYQQSPSSCNRCPQKEPPPDQPLPPPQTPARALLPSTDT